MKCPNCGGKLKETEGVLYGGKHAYYCILCGYKIGYINKISYESNRINDRRLGNW